MALVCPECGAEWSEEATCQSCFDSFLALEFTDPAYGNVHFLTVACFMIQHGRYSHEAIVGIAALLKASFEEKLTTSELRQRANLLTGGEDRAWNVLRRTDEPPPPRPVWSMTIIDVARQVQDATNYCDLVRQWASLTFQEVEKALASR